MHFMSKAAHMLIPSIIKPPKGFPKQKLAYSCEGQELSFERLHTYADNLSNFLYAQGSTPVIIYGHKSPLMLVCIAACIKAARAYVPCDCSIPRGRLQSIASQCEAGIVLCTEQDLIFPPIVSTVEHSELLRITQESIYPPCKARINPDDDCYIMFTSGSTGMPKGVRVSYANVENFAQWFCQIKAIKELSPKAVQNQAALSFDLSVADIYYSLTNAASLYAIDFFSQQSEFCPSKGISHEAELAVMTPSFAELCMFDYEFRSEFLPRLKCIFFCGETLKPSTVKKLFTRFEGIRIINAYGPTEATCAVSAVEITSQMLNFERLPIGEVSSAAVDISIADKDGNELRDGYIGEIVLCGKSVARGFGTGEGFKLINGKHCYFTGDMGYISDGLLYIMGRFDRQVKYKGYRIELDDIESNLSGIDGVKQVIVTANTDSSGEVIALSAYLSCDVHINAQQIKSKALKLLPSCMIPKNIIIADRFTLTSNGKIDRRMAANTYDNN